MNLWHQFYSNIRDQSWPDCINETEFVFLPDKIQQEILQEHNGSKYITLGADDVETQTCEHWSALDNKSLTENRALTYIKIASDFRVYFSKEMEGGGLHFGQNYPRVLRYLYPNQQFDHCLEWCAGAAFIGFRILSDGICKRLTLLEAYRPAVDACRVTSTDMPARCATNVNVVHGNKIKQLDMQIKFDLVVGNPPHFAVVPSWFGEHDIANANRICVDKDWQTHQEFFANIKTRLAPNGVILLQENINGSSVHEFREFIESHGLRVGRCIRETACPEFWYLEVLHAE